MEEKGWGRGVREKAVVGRTLEKGKVDLVEWVAAGCEWGWGRVARGCGVEGRG
jgi:hypothetical protein